MESNSIRKIGLIPVADRTDEDKELYTIYAKARDCTTGSMMLLADALRMENTEFYSKLDTDHKFREAIMQGFSDGRSARLLELESALINLACGYHTTEHRTGVDAEGGTFSMTVTKELPPHLPSLELLLEKMQGSAWSVKKDVILDNDVVSKEIDYKMLTKKQLKTLAEGDK